jgi:hypothetical protein
VRYGGASLRLHLKASGPTSYVLIFCASASNAPTRLRHRKYRPATNGSANPLKNPQRVDWIQLSYQKTPRPSPSSRKTNALILIDYKGPAVLVLQRVPVLLREKLK